jgi:hypothetical protein
MWRLPNRVLSHNRSIAFSGPFVGGTVHHGVVSEGDDNDPYELPGGEYVRWLDNLGPEHLHGISRYPSYPDDMDWSEAILDPHSEAVGRFVGACSQLEIALFRARSELDGLLSFAEAERARKPQGCIEDLRGIAGGLPERPAAQLRMLLDDAMEHLQLRNGVVHGTYRRNHLERASESRRYVFNKETKQYDLVRVPYDRDSLLLATVRASNVAADILDGVAQWREQLQRAARERRSGVAHPMVYEDPTSGGDSRLPSGEGGHFPPTAVLLHALAKNGLATVCGLGATGLNRYRDLAFEDSNPINQCGTCIRVIGR